MSETLNDVTAALTQEDVPSLADFADEPGGALSPGWYAAEIIEGYSTQKGKVLTTDDALAQKGDSRNATFCFRLTVPAGERSLFHRVNYRVSDFTPDRLAFIKEARKEHAGVQGKWHDDPDAQRTSIMLGKLGMFEEALGFPIHTKDGTLAPYRTIGQKVDVRVNINKEGYNDVTGFDKAGSKTSRARK